MNAILPLCCFTLAFSCTVVAQPKVTFEVVAIKPVHRPTLADIQARTSPIGMKIDGALVQIRGYTLVALLSSAFRVSRQQVIAPDFARSEYFDVQAKLPENATRDQVSEMLQAMLAERFKLSYHHETRDYMVNVLTVGKNGMKLPRLPDDTPQSGNLSLFPMAACE
jgi:uncharacterized protein (TIGR03435 family)